MTATYDLTTDVGRLRLAIGDTDTANAMFSDEELQVFITAAGSWEQAALMAVDGLIAKYAQLVTFALGPRKEALSDIVDHYQALRTNLAAGLAGFIGTDDLSFSWTEEAVSSSTTEYAS